jgi:2-polyprenyl-3-methyl-5-hydroxy-6-metoxy-1,4-benzoquinol methylase
VPDESPPQCPICGEADPDLVYQITRFQVLRCRACTQIFLYPLLSPEEIREMFARLYTEGEGSVPELKSYYAYCYDDDPQNPLVQLYERWLDELEKHRSPGSLLDVGCGTGLFLSVARRRGWEPFGIDDSAEATKHARDHFGLDVWVGDFADFQAERREDRRFDVITGWDIIEHARKPLEVLEAMRACLGPEGVVALSTPNQRNILDVIAGALYRLSGGRATWALEKFYIEQHFLYYTPDTLARSLELAGFEVAQMKRELTDLRRLTLSPAIRGVLQSLFALARLTGLENRLFVVARPRTS